MTASPDQRPVTATMHIERMTTRQSRSVIRVASPGPRAGLVEVPAGGLELAPELVDLAAHIQFSTVVTHPTPQ